MEAPIIRSNLLSNKADVNAAFTTEDLRVPRSCLLYEPGQAKAATTLAFLPWPSTTVIIISAFTVRLVIDRAGQNKSLWDTSRKATGWTRAVPLPQSNSDAAKRMRSVVVMGTSRRLRSSLPTRRDVANALHAFNALDALDALAALAALAALDARDALVAFEATEAIDAFDATEAIDAFDATEAIDAFDATEATDACWSPRR
ncbi:hypothetical protein B0A55_12905 [Friedmanniomyces simplex]|uniref:Uncharacterized protein n=1 Tax=Friedmanniomyces simplex TaxID=329884 RepID=A0A4U0WQP1_9PEZI|nr:hypothetical protein B0A55_12905 [Friedmanniomyces simplex]